METLPLMGGGIQADIGLGVLRCCGITARSPLLLVLNPKTVIPQHRKTDAKRCILPFAMKVAVLGSGSWGTALSILLARNDHEVSLIGRNEEEILALRGYRENLHYLPGFAIPQNVAFGTLEEGLPFSDLLVVAVPSGAVRGVLAEAKGQHPLIVVASKGLEAGSAKTMCEVASDVMPDAEVGGLSGPNLAIEIAQGVPTVAIAAFAKEEQARVVQQAFMRRTFRVSITNDIVGVELSGALKNVLAIGAGMSDGLGFGDNTKGAFLSRGLMEMSRLGLAMGARMDTFLGPAGVGDLFATAVSRLSRNYRVGRAIGEGGSLAQALEAVGQVAEGVPTSEAAMLLARRHSVQMPVFAAVESVLKSIVQPRVAVEMLMDRSPRIDDFLGHPPE